MQLDPDEIRSYQQQAFFEKDKSAEITPFAIFLAVLAAILVAWLIRAAYVEWQARQAIAMFNQQMQALHEQTTKSIERMQIRQQRIMAEAQEKARLKEEAAYQQKLAIRQMDLDRRAAIAAKNEMAMKKEEAWKNYYKPAKGCESENPNIDLIKCGNDHAKARKLFEASWASAH